MVAFMGVYVQSLGTGTRLDTLTSKEKTPCGAFLFLISLGCLLGFEPRLRVPQTLVLTITL